MFWKPSRIEEFREDAIRRTCYSAKQARASMIAEPQERDRRHKRAAKKYSNIIKAIHMSLKHATKKPIIHAWKCIFLNDKP